MATDAQITANRKNSKASTGPTSETGKSKSARNSTKFGLFATNNCVQPEEKDQYDNFCSSLWDELAPASSIEEVTAAEFVRNAWRLRRCAMAEERLGQWAARQQASQNKYMNSATPAADPILYEDGVETQNAIDRARVSAQSGMRRAKADLDKLQEQRAARIAAQIEANSKVAPLQIEPKTEAIADPISSEEAQTPRNAPCPCGSGVKFKRCCGIGAPPILQAAA